MARAFADLVYANEPGTLLYVLTKHPTREHTYVWVERYRDAVAAERHRDSSYMAEVRPKFAGVRGRTAGAATPGAGGAALSLVAQAYA